jgi:hypothetical protein
MPQKTEMEYESHKSQLMYSGFRPEHDPGPYEEHSIAIQRFGPRSPQRQHGYRAIKQIDKQKGFDRIRLAREYKRRIESRRRSSTTRPAAPFIIAGDLGRLLAHWSKHTSPAGLQCAHAFYRLPEGAKSRQTSPNVGPTPMLRARIMGVERSYGWRDHARAIPKSACLGAIEFLESAFRENPSLPEPEVSPSPRGGVTLSWWFGDTGFLARFFTKRGKIYFQQESPDFRAEIGTESRDGVLRRLARLSGLGKTS